MDLIIKYEALMVVAAKIMLENHDFSSNRSSGAEVFCRKVVLRNFAKFTGKHLCQSLLLIKF